MLESHTTAHAPASKSRKYRETAAIAAGAGDAARRRAEAAIASAALPQHRPTATRSAPTVERDLEALRSMTCTGSILMPTPGMPGASHAQHQGCEGGEH